MKKSRHSEEQIMGVWKQMEAGRKVAEGAREVGVSEARRLQVQLRAQISLGTITAVLAAIERETD